MVGEEDSSSISAILVVIDLLAESLFASIRTEFLLDLHIIFLVHILRFALPTYLPTHLVTCSPLARFLYVPYHVVSIYIPMLPTAF